MSLTGDKIHKTFISDKGVATRALDNVSFQVRRGALTALVGPDGAGKTTLMRLAAGLMTADSGDLTVLGIDVAAELQQVQSRIGYMPQRFGLYQDLSVQENLDLYSDVAQSEGLEVVRKFDAPAPCEKQSITLLT